MMRIVVMVGLPGSGKSGYLESLGVTGLSSDSMRGLLADNETDQSINPQVFEALRYLLRLRLSLRRPVTYIDATNLTPDERRPYIEIGESFGCPVDALVFDVPLEVCLLRNSRRHRVVPLEAMLKLAAKLVMPTLAEGFNRIDYVSTPYVSTPDSNNPKY